MSIGVRIDSITISDGTTVDTSSPGVVVFVGPNNSGKSQSLKDILGFARDAPSYRGKSVTAVVLTKTGTDAEALEWAKIHIPQARRAGIDRMNIDGWGEVGPTDFASQWSGVPGYLNVLTNTFMLHADGQTRLTSGNAQASIDFRNQFPTHPIQRAAREPRLERDFDSVSRSAFGLGVTVDRFSGAVIPLRLGQRPTFDHLDGSPTDEYLAALDQLPPLEDQGDGVKSFMGLMIQLIAGSHQIVLVDEPEAFLHPPQARLLGRLLAERTQHQQVFLATHSADIVQGLLESGMNVTIVRLRRRGGVNDAAVLPGEAVATLWGDPLLRYSDVLSGLFHDAVVLCESDSDCRYYAAVRDALIPDDGETRRPELLFTHCGGKARIPVVVRALRAVRVPVVVVSDFDLLRDAGDVRRVVQEMGGDPDSFLPARDLLDHALLADSKPLRLTPTRDALLERLATCAETLIRRDIEELRAILRIETGWDKVKRSGLAGVPQGDAVGAARQVLAAMRELGVLVVPVGELERFVPEVGGHGPAWANEVLARSLHLDPDDDARQFVTAIDEAARRQR